MKRIPGAICACLLLTAHPGAAQSARQSPTLIDVERADARKTVTAIVDAPVLLIPDTSRQPLRVAKAGSRLILIEQTGDWCRVEFQDPEFGRRQGYVQTKYVQVQLAPQAEAQVKPDAMIRHPPSPWVPRRGRAVHWLFAIRAALVRL